MPKKPKNPKQFTHLQFIQRFKTIRKQYNHQLYQFLLMRDTQTKRFVIAKNNVYENQQELQKILQDYQQLLKLYQPESGDSCCCCQFIGFCVEQLNNQNVIYLIYDYHQETLAQTISSMKLHNSHTHTHKTQNFFTQASLNQFLTSMLTFLINLQNYGSNCLCWSFHYILVQNLGNIDMKFNFLFTPFLVDAVQEIQSQKPDIQDYFLSQLQLQNFTASKYIKDINYSEKLRSDKQSLGLMALKMATITNQYDKFYQMNTNYQLVWNQNGLKNRIQALHNNYSKQLQNKIQYLIFDRSFYSFKDLPIFAIKSNSYSSPNGKLMNKSRISDRYPSRSRSRVSCTSKKSMQSRQSIQQNNSNNNNSKKQSKNKTSKYNSHNKYTDNQFSSIKRSYYDQEQHQVSNLNNISFDSVGSFSRQIPQKNNNNNNNNNIMNININRELLRADQPEKIKKINYQKQLKYYQSIFYQQIPKDTLHHLSDPKIGEKYIGQVKNGRKNGLGINYNRQGDVYFGQWNTDQMTGQGTYLFKNGDVYTGQIKKGLKHGQGKYQHWNGNYYDGHWQNDLKNGKGIYIYKTKGDTYEGYFKDNIRHGFGLYKWNNGSKYQGNFVKGIKHGSGTATLINGTKIQGNWNNDNLQSNFTKIKYPSGSLYSGNFENNQIIGQGIQNKIDGFYCKGTYKNNQRNGYCQIRYPNGDQYYGEIYNNVPHGQGKYIYMYQEYQYAGGWKNGYQDGNGIVRFKNGTEIQCRWQMGKYEKIGKIKYINGDEYCGQISGLGRNGRGVYVNSDGEKVHGFFQNGVLIDTQ